MYVFHQPVILGPVFRDAVYKESMVGGHMVFCCASLSKTINKWQIILSVLLAH